MPGPMARQLSSEHGTALGQKPDRFHMHEARSRGYLQGAIKRFDS